MTTSEKERLEKEYEHVVTEYCGQIERLEAEIERLRERRETDAERMEVLGMENAELRGLLSEAEQILKDCTPAEGDSYRCDRLLQEIKEAIRP